MRTFVDYIPYIIAPFLFAEVAPFFRLAALLVLMPYAGYRIYQDWIQENPANYPYSLSPWLFVLLIGLAAIEMFVLNVGYTHSIWPAAVSGGLLLIAMNRNQASIIWGVAATGAVLWILLLLNPLVNGLLPSENFQQTVGQKFPLVLATDNTVPMYPSPSSPPILSPKPQSVEILFHSALVLTTALFFALAFTEFSRIPALLRGILLPFWCLVLLLLAGRSSFMLLGINTIIFTLLTQSKESLTHWRDHLSLILFLLFCILGYLFDFSLLFSLFLPPYATRQLFSDRNFTFQWSDILHEGFQRIAIRSDSATFFALLIFAALFVLCLDYTNRRLKEDVRLPLAASILLFVFLSTVPVGLQESLPTWLAHPLLWLSVGMMRSASWSPAFEKRPPLVQWSYIPEITALAALYVSLFSVGYLFQEWRAQTALNRFAHAEGVQKQFEAAQTAFRWAGHRGDTASVYACALMRGITVKGLLPSEQQLQELEAAIYVSARNEYNPVLAYKTLVDLLWTAQKREDVLRILKAGITRFPRVLFYHEMHGDYARAQGKMNEALLSYHIASNLDPTNPRIRYKLAQTYQTLGKGSEFDRERRILLSLDPSAKLE